MHRPVGVLQGDSDHQRLTTGRRRQAGGEQAVALPIRAETGDRPYATSGEHPPEIHRGQHGRLRRGVPGMQQDGPAHRQRLRGRLPTGSPDSEASAASWKPDSVSLCEPDEIWAAAASRLRSMPATRSAASRSGRNTPIAARIAASSPTYQPVSRTRTGRVIWRAAIGGPALAVAVAVCILASLGAFFSVSKARMTRQAAASAPVDWQVLLGSGADPADAEQAIAALPGVRTFRPVGYADTTGLHAAAGDTQQTTGPGKVLGLPPDYATAFPGEIRLLTGSAAGIQTPRSQSSTVPPPYCPSGMSPSKSPYEIG